MIDGRDGAGRQAPHVGVGGRSTKPRGSANGASVARLNRQAGDSLPAPGCRSPPVVDGCPCSILGLSTSTRDRPAAGAGPLTNLNRAIVILPPIRRARVATPMPDWWLLYSAGNPTWRIGPMRFVEAHSAMPSRLCQHSLRQSALKLRPPRPIGPRMLGLARFGASGHVRHRLAAPRGPRPTLSVRPTPAPERPVRSVPKRLVRRAFRCSAPPPHRGIRPQGAAEKGQARGQPAAASAARGPAGSEGSCREGRPSAPACRSA